MIRTVFLPIILLFSFQLVSGQELDSKGAIDFPFTKVSLRNALHHITNQSTFTFAYDAGRLPLGKKLHFNKSEMNVLEFCEFLKETEGIDWTILGNQIILSRLVKEYFHIDGFVYDAKTGESLIGAHIYTLDGKYGTTSNQDGYFNLILEEGENKLVISYISYETILDSISVYQDQRTNYNLHAGFELSQILVIPRILDSIQNKDHILWDSDSLRYEGYNVSYLEQSRQLPSYTGEPDLLRLTQLLPGVIPSSSGNSAFDVRGGTQDQNLVLLESVQLYNYTHRNGISLFNSSVINHAQLHKNKTPTRFAGRLSSVLDIYLKDGNKYNKEWEAAIGSNAFKLMSSGPIINTNTTYVAAGRASWVNLLNNLTSQITDSPEQSYFFHDYYGKLTNQATEKDKISFSFYIGADRTKDEFNMDSMVLNNSLRQQTYLASLKWSRIISNEWFLQSNLTFSKFFIDQDNQTSLNSLPQSRSEFETGIEDFTLNIQLENRQFSNQKIFTGAKFIHHRFRPGRSTSETFSIDGESIFSTVSGEDLNSVEANIYVEDEYAVNKYLNVITGINITSLITDTKLHGRLEPRLSIIWNQSKKNTFQLDYSQNTQYVHFLGNTARSNFSPGLWVTSTAKIKPQSSKMLSLRYNQRISNQLEIDISPYYKRYNNITRYRDRLQLQNSIDDWESFLNIFDGYTSGVEFLIQKSGRKLNMSFAYAYSINTLTLLNETDYFPAKNDHKHAYNIVGLYNYQSRRKKNKTKYFGAVWSYYSGGFMTLPDIVIPDENNEAYTLNYSALNNFQLLPIHSLDISFSSKKLTKRGNIRYINYGLINFYDRSNSYNYQLNVINDNLFLNRELSPTDFLTAYFQYALKF